MHGGGQHHHHGAGCGHGDGHGHGHHAHAPVSHGRAFAIGITLNLAFVCIELFYGWAAGSLALVSDAVHNFSDVIGLVLAWGGAWLATRKPTPQRTFGYRRASILAALGNAALLFVAVGVIVMEAVSRIANPLMPAGTTVMVVAGIGVVINFGTALLFMGGRHKDVNIRGAYLHMAADAAVSLGVLISGLVIMMTGAAWIDAALSLVIALVILISTWGLARESVNMAMDAVPAHIDRDAVMDFLKNLPGVASVHDLHIWPMSTTEIALTAHIVRPGAAQDDDDRFLHDTAATLDTRFGIGHATLQVETGGGEACVLEPDHVI